MSDISGIKAQVSEALRAKNSGGALADTSGNSDLMDAVKVGLGSMVAVGGVVWLLTAWLSPKEVVKPADTGNAQIDQAMQMLQEQQDMNRKLLEGQQELNAQMIEAQSKAKTVQPSINCFLAVCPGTGSQEGQPNDQYAIVGEGIRTARIDPERFQLQPQQPQQPAQPQPNYSGNGQTVDFDPNSQLWQEHYGLLQAHDSQTFSNQWNECAAANWQIPADGRINCTELGKFVNRNYGGNQ